MTRTTFLLVGTIAVLVAALASCSPDPRAPSLYGIGEYCFRGEDCESGLCGESSCTIACTGDADCAAAGESLAHCDPDGYCVAPCDSERAPLFESRVCVGGRATDCSALDATYCDVCEGSCPGQRCVAEVGCVPLSDVGEECTVDSDCRTDNCSAIAGVCRVPLEAACDDTNCDVCISHGTWSYCSRDCTFGIGDCLGGRCIGYVDENFFYCRPACGAGCPGGCTTSTDGTRYCSEGVGDDWTLSQAPSAPLEACRYTAMCSAGECLTARSCDSRASSCTGRRGTCSETCASDSDCGDEGRCVDVPCSADAPTAVCGLRCLPACETEGSSNECAALAQAMCRTMPSATGGTATVCDPRNGDGERCARGTDCASGTCSSAGRCAPAGGAENGTACGVPTDCRSGNCQSGTCRGTSLRGDPCTTPFDCSVGTCVSGVCD